MLEERAGIPVVGVAPYMQLEVEDEDSLTERFNGNQEVGLIDIAVIRVPRISNFSARIHGGHTAGKRLPCFQRD